MADDDDLFAWAKRRRDEGIERALEGEERWCDQARDMVKALVPPGWRGLFEEVRFMLKEAGLVEPHTYKCWGALSMWLIRNQYLIPLDDHAHPTDPKSHACKKQLLLRSFLR